jgi:MscS family membrane protein
MLKTLILFFVFFITGVLNLHAEVKYSPLIDTQLVIEEKMNDSNLTQAEIKALVHEQEKVYREALDSLMANKQAYLENMPSYDAEIFSLKKIISIKKRAGNTYAVLRDEVKIKSYLILQSQNIMKKNILLALDTPTIEKFDEKLNQYITQNQEDIYKINNKDYKKYLTITPASRVLQQAQKNIKEYYMIIDINNDIISYVYKFKDKMYRLNKYSKYHLIKPVMYINSLDLVKIINPFLDKVGLDVIKIFLIVFLIIAVYFFRTIVYVALERYLLQLDFYNKYSEEIVGEIKKPIEWLIIIINLNMILYVYYNFSSVAIVVKVFNIIYGAFFTLLIYKIINVIAGIKLSKFERNNTQVKRELINVGIKIINFFIVIIGILIALYFAGVDLTAVLSGLGIGGFAVAFAAKDTISNFFGTLSILFSDAFSQGDWIEIDGKEGTVVEIGLRVTTIRTFDNALIAMPNGTFASKDVKNWNKRKLGRRIKMKLGIKYDSKRVDIQNAIVAIREMLVNHPEIATPETKYENTPSKRRYTAKLVSADDLYGIKKTLLVYLDEFSDSSIDILIYCFSKSVDWEEWLQTKQDVMEKIMFILEENSLEFAFPSLSIYKEN